SSRWLDLDRIAGSSEMAGPLESIVPLAIGLRDLLPPGRSRARFSVDQANVGREAVNGISLSLARSGDALEIEELKLGMPGGSRGELRGSVTGPPESPAFEGNISLRGTSLVRFLGWASAGTLSFDSKGDGTFGVRTRLSIDQEHAAARDMVGDIAGTAIAAAAQYRCQGRPELSVSVEGPQLDARAFLPAGASLADVFDLILHGLAPTADQGPARPGWRSAQTDAVLRLNAGQLVTAARSYRDVAVEIELKGGRLKLPLLRVAGDEGFTLELEGEVDDAAAHPKGSLRGVIAADSLEAVLPLAELLGVPEALRPDAKRARAMVPLRLAGSMAFGTRTPRSTDLVIDGDAKGAGVKLNVRLDGSQAGSRAGPADLVGTIEGSDAAAVAALLAPAGSESRGSSTGPGRILVKASGVPSQGLATLASVETGDLDLSFRGSVVAADNRGSAASGELDIRATDGARMAEIVGLPPALRLEGMPIAGSLAVRAESGKIALDHIALDVAGSRVKGAIAVAREGEQSRVEARIALDRLSVAKLLAPLLDQRLAVAAAAEAAVTGQQSVWPDEPFDFTALDAFEGSVQLTADRLTVADGIGLSQAAVDIALEKGKVDVTRLEGIGLGGRFSGTLRIAKAAAGADVDGSVRL